MWLCLINPQAVLQLLIELEKGLHVWLSELFLCMAHPPSAVAAGVSLALPPCISMMVMLQHILPEQELLEDPKHYQVCRQRGDV